VLVECREIRRRLRQEGERTKRVWTSTRGKHHIYESERDETRNRRKSREGGGVSGGERK